MPKRVLKISESNMTLKTYKATLSKNKVEDNMLNKDHNTKPNNRVQLECKKLLKRMPKRNAKITFSDQYYKNNNATKHRALPIYRTQMPEEIKNREGNFDPYEFNEFSHKIKKTAENCNKESLVFGKQSDNILRKIEGKESRGKTKIMEKKKEFPVKTYDNIVDGIVKNVMGKIQRKMGSNVVQEPVNKSKVIIRNSCDIDSITELSRGKNGHISEVLSCNESQISDVYSSPKKQPNNISLKKTSTPLATSAFQRKSLDTNSPRSSPWRVNWITSKPRYISLKSNALPRIDQEMVLDYSLVENLEESRLKTSLGNEKTPAKKPPVQQSILDYVESNHEKMERPMEMSLFDYDLFISPVKKNVKQKENKAIETVKKDFVPSGTPIRRKILGDISNSPEEHSSRENTSQSFSTSARFDQSKLKSYAPKNRVKFKPGIESAVSVENLGDISIINQSDYRLFDEPGDFLDDTSMVIVNEKKRRRCSASSDISDSGRKHKKHKKNELEVETEKWIETFNKECEEVSNYNLDVD